jgi:hypothetical protein
MRKIHSSECGYIAERMNPHIPGKKVVIYRAEEQEIDVGGDKYAVVCDAHGTIGNANSVRDARFIMKNPGEFCVDCRALAGQS